ncbi:HAD family hydrolase [Streptomyces sp. NPDC059003]|uniref:HAD family hydrolase n=1 Tax=Streptomyces sp. NPDC059003 TaxID=3346691 RepID=UPI00369C22F8
MGRRAGHGGRHPALPRRPGRADGPQGRRGGHRAGHLADPEPAALAAAPAVLDLLDTTVCREDAKPKPAPDGIFLALARLAVTPHDAVFVGDTLTDRAAAFEAGVVFAGAGWGYAGADALAAASCPVILTDPAQIGPGLLSLVPAGGAPQQVSAPAR